jgi:hypothetical protein
MATLCSKRTDAPEAQPEEQETRGDARAGTLASRGTGLWWLWLVSDQAMIGTRRPDQAAARPGDEVARSWALADLALNGTDS